ncbi:MAG: hypothetical protein ABEN55_18600, partial [Bradymonadaceae bacterium]
MNVDRQTVERTTAIAAGLCAVGVYIVAYQWPMFTLHAPQYPEGLDLVLYLDHLEGDVSEINGLNHYIGMAKLGEAAQLEKAYSHWGIGLLCLLVGGGIWQAGWRVRWYVLTVAAAFPVVFCIDQYYWLYRFGHHLDPRAPINIDPFTPSMFGTGKIRDVRDVGSFVADTGRVFVECQMAPEADGDPDLMRELGLEPGADG